MRVVVFGLGKEYRENRNNFSESDEIVAFSDNNVDLQGKCIEGKRIVAPSEICGLVYDKVVIMTSQLFAYQIKKQLIDLDVADDKIVYWGQYIYGEKKYDLSQKIVEKSKRNVLIVTSDFGYHGGAMVCIFLAQILEREGYDVKLTASRGSADFVNEYSMKGFNIEILKGIQYAKAENIEGITDFDFVIVNTYPMILLALEINEKIKTMLWLHESIFIYEDMEYWLSNVKARLKQTNLKIYAVSDFARENFYKRVEKRDIPILEYGVPDVDVKPASHGSGLTFAIIGTVSSFKQQHLFIDAVELLQSKQKEKNRFWIIGKFIEEKYANNILEKIEKKEYVQYLGEKTQGELNVLYDEIDVIVVCSVQESLPIVVIEGLMRQKPCIVCDNTGFSKYFHNGIEGIKYKVNNIYELTCAMQFFIENRELIPYMGKMARKLYESKFSLQSFAERLQGILME